MQTTHPSRLPLSRLAIAQVVASALLVALGAGLAAPFNGEAVASAAPAFGVVLVGIIAAISFLAFLPARDWQEVPMRVLVAGGLRMMIGIMGALWFWFAFSPDRVSFWLLFVTGALAALTAEVMTILPVLRTAQAETAAPQGEAA